MITTGHGFKHNGLYEQRSFKSCRKRQEWLDSTHTTTLELLCCIFFYVIIIFFFVCVYYIKWTCIVCFSAGHVPLIYPRSSRREGARAVQGLAYVHSSVPSIDQLIV